MKNPTILFQDASLLVLNKPPNVTVNNAETTSEPTLEQWLTENFPNKLERQGIVHRLDKDTSGVLVVARTQAALTELQRQFKAREVQKEYIALVHDIVSEKTGAINAAIARNPKNRMKFALVESGREAQTNWQVDAYYQLPREKLLALLPDLNKNQQRYYFQHAMAYSLVRLFPKTGRTHQIRVHLSALRHPLVSDTVYTGRKLLKLDLLWCPRLFLHAAQLMFKHPEIGQSLTFSQPLPDDLRQGLAVLEKAA